jgi:hypothetical protein
MFRRNETQSKKINFLLFLNLIRKMFFYFFFSSVFDHVVYIEKKTLGNKKTIQSFLSKEKKQRMT